jgi:redox-sensitive bicupin YhaK (pirin superfamily)
VRFLEIWIEPAVSDIDPSYQQIPFAPDEKHNRFRLLAARGATNQKENPAVIHQDAFIYAAELEPGQDLRRPLALGRYAWVPVARGNIALNGESLAEGDGAAISEESDLAFSSKGSNAAEFLLFDLA